MMNTLTPEKVREWKQVVGAAWNDPEQLKTPVTQQALIGILRAL